MNKDNIIDFYRKRYIKSMRMYLRTSKDRSRKEFDRILAIYGDDVEGFVNYIILDIESAKEDHTWRKHHVICSEQW